MSSPSSGTYENQGGSHRPVTLYIWSALLLVVPLAIGAWFRAGASPRAIAIVTLLSAVVGLAGGILTGYSLRSPRDVIRAAVISGGALSLGLFIIPALIAAATSADCTTANCDLEPAASAVVFFGISSLISFVIVGIGYRLGRWEVLR